MKDSDQLQITGVMSKGYGVMPKMVALDRNLSIEAKAIYAFLTSFSGVGQGVFPSIDTIIHYLNISENRFLKYRKELINNGYITIQKRYSEGKRTSNLYILNMEITSLHLQNECIENKCIENKCVGFEGTNNNNINNNKLNNNNTNLKKKKETSIDSIINNYTNDEELRNTLLDFIKMRKSIKKPMTDRALQLLLKKLEGLSNSKEIQIKILENSIVNSWQGIFPLKEVDTNGQYSRSNSKQQYTSNNTENKKFNIKREEFDPSKYKLNEGDMPV